MYIPLVGLATSCLYFFSNWAHFKILFSQRRNNFNSSRRRMSGRAARAQREDSIRRTVYVSDIDQNVSEVGELPLFLGLVLLWYSLRILSWFVFFLLKQDYWGAACCLIQQLRTSKLSYWDVVMSIFSACSTMTSLYLIFKIKLF